MGGYYVPDKFVRAADLNGRTDGDISDAEGAAWKTVFLDAATGRPTVPNGSLGFRWTESGKGRWNLDLQGVEPRLSLLGMPGAIGAEVLLPRFDIDGDSGAPQGPGGIHTRGVPAMRLRPARHHGRRGVEYVWFNNVETRPGLGYPRRFADQEKWRGGWELDAG